MTAQREHHIKCAKQDLELIGKASIDEAFLDQLYKKFVDIQISNGYSRHTPERFILGMQILKEKAERCLYEVTRIPPLNL